MERHGGKSLQVEGPRCGEDLRGRILQAWDELDQRIIDKAVGEWCKRLRVCVNAAGEQFEYKL